MKIRAEVKLILFLLFLVSVLEAQNNGIFNGGMSMGWAIETHSVATNSGIFTGGPDEGFGISAFSMIVNSSIFAGGKSDGEALANYAQETNGEIFAGGSGDGEFESRYEGKTNNSIFAGGMEDGYDNESESISDNGEIFAGGTDDGYSYSRLSKLIWTGAISKDWLMASNWNLYRIPTQSDQAIIASGAPKYPSLDGKLQVGVGNNYTYVCNSLEIHFGAQLNGNSNSWFMNDIGRIEVRGTMTFYKNDLNQNVNKQGSIIRVLNGGQLHIIE